MSKNESIDFEVPRFILDDEPLCSQTDPEMFFPQENHQNRGYYRYERQAKAVCRICPLMEKCLSYAVANPNLIGIWGGTTERERRRFRGSRR